MPYFEFIGEDVERKTANAEKFWEIQLDGTKLTVRFGKIGSTGQYKVKDYDSLEESRSEFEKLIKEKVKKGYVEKQIPAQ